MSLDRVSRLTGLACLIALILIFFQAVLFRGEQYGYRDAAHFYYPLYQLVQQEWEAGRVPLWEPQENGGMPLLGNPTAAVLYPGKLIYAAFPYAWGARLYAIAHTALAFATMFALIRGFGVSAAGSAIGALGYAFGVPVVFQYCNIIFLVSAAWAPLGFLGLHAWIDRRDPKALWLLSLALTMEVLGGDPQIAYLTGLCGAGYAIAAARSQARAEAEALETHGEQRRRGFGRGLLIATLVLIGIAAWIAAVLAIAEIVPSTRSASQNPQMKGPWFPESRWLVRGLWALVLLIWLWSLRSRKDWVRRMNRHWFGLIGAAALASLICAAQLLPTWEFASLSLRAVGNSPHDFFPFSVIPYRFADLLWPNVFGKMYNGSGMWLEGLPPLGRHKFWTPGHYMGASVLLLGLVGLTWRRGPLWGRWLAAVAVISALGAIGEYLSPLYWARMHPAGVERFGPPDDPEPMPIRDDGELRDGEGGFYWALGTFLPGFGIFRYPAKLFTMTALALSCLAGLGWDRVASGARGRFALILGLLIAASLAALIGVEVNKARIAAFFESVRLHTGTYGVSSAGLMIRGIEFSLIHAVAALGIAGIAAWRAQRNPRFASALAIGGLALDLAIANSWLILTLPQGLFETPIKAQKLIEDAEARDPSDGPFRVHRMPLWHPLGWGESPPSHPLRVMNEWERQTLQPKYGIDSGIHFLKTEGTMELYDYSFFFGGFYRTIVDIPPGYPIKSGDRVVAFARRAFDMWGARYFVIPGAPGFWDNEHRGFLSFIAETKAVYPTSAFMAASDPESTAKRIDWVKNEDLQILKNLNAYPRAWIVHDLRPFPQGMEGLSADELNKPIQEMTYSADAIWNVAGRTVFDPRKTVWVEFEAQPELIGHLRGRSGAPRSEQESVRVVKYEPQRVELAATLDQPGIIVLADAFYPGWRLEIDGQPAKIHRANWMMRGAAVTAGEHRLVYRYQPDSFRWGVIGSAAGLACWAILGIVARRARKS